MAQKFLSPGVFTTELDQSQLAAGVAGIGAAFVGRAQKGPAFQPVLVTGYDDFAMRFGGVDPDFSLPYAARGYLQNAGSAVVVRVLGHKDGSSTVQTNSAFPSGWSIPTVVGITDSTGSYGQVLLELHSQYPVQVSGVANDANNFVLRIVSGASTVVFGVTASFLTASANYVGKVLNSDPTKWSTYFHYVFRNIRYATPIASASWQVALETSASTWTRDFEGGVTQYFKSQPLGGQEYNLFRLYSRGHGLAENDRLKITIANIKPSPNTLVTRYGTFDILVRDFYDTDQRPVLLESFVGLTLDPDSDNYILRRIGDVVDTFDTLQRKFVQTGTWPAKSKLIYVDIPTTVSAPPEALPWGFRGYIDPLFQSLFTGSAPSAAVAIGQMPYVQTQKDRFGNVDPNICWGVQFLSGGIVDRMRPLPDSIETNGLYNSDTDFSLSFVTASYLNGRQVYAYNPNLAANLQQTPVYQSASLYKFTVPLRGGHDGWDIRVYDPLYLNNTDDETVLGVVSVKRAIDALANPDYVDMNMLSIPNQDNLKVTDYARTMVNNRQDAFYVMDVTGASVSEVVGQLAARQIDDNYSACYYPDIKIEDKINKKMVRVKPSVLVPAAVAYNDRTAQPWFAPAGLNRGSLKQFDAKDVLDRLNIDDRNTLYDNRVNPIATFPDSGISIWGQKTLQTKPSALDRVNVRRLLIFAKKTIASAAKYLVFEPNNPATWDRFVKMVNPILKRVQQDQGLNRFKVVMDTTTNTADVVDRNAMVGKIFLEPTKAGEFIDLSFVITAQGVTFGS